jgi:predicted transglutaminase-like cysteine proteinase
MVMITWLLGTILLFLLNTTGILGKKRVRGIRKFYYQPGKKAHMPMKSIHYILFLLLSIGGFQQTGTASLSHDYQEIRIENQRIMATMQDWLKRSKTRQHLLEHSDHAVIASWRQQLQDVHFNNELEGLQKLNTLINEDVGYRDDYSHYHKKDYWAEPDLVLEEGGDCEDIALLKAASLLRLQWPAARMQLLIGYLIEAGRKESHAVLLVITRQGHQMIMRSVKNEIVPPDRFPFLPIYAVNGEGVFLVKPDI